MGKTIRPPLQNPYQIVSTKGLVYVQKRKYVVVMVFTKWYSEIDLLSHHIGGKWYRHGSGYTWILANRDALSKLITDLRDHSFLPTNRGLEDVIYQQYPEIKPPDD